MGANLKGWLVLVLLLVSIAYCIAEELTLTTYYPSPRGGYNELRVGSAEVSSPTAKLHVVKPENDGRLALRVDDQLPPDSSPFVIDEQGNVGIGTTAPNYQLDVLGNINASDAVRAGGRALPRRSMLMFTNGTEQITSTTNAYYGIGNLGAGPGDRMGLPIVGYVTNLVVRLYGSGRATMRSGTYTFIIADGLGRDTQLRCTVGPGDARSDCSSGAVVNTREQSGTSLHVIASGSPEPTNFVAYVEILD